MIKWLSNKIKSLFVSNSSHPDKEVLSISWQASWVTHLNETVAF